jgi:Domain of unknown function (DUF4402)
MKKIIIIGVLFTAIGANYAFAQTQSVNQSANVNLTVQTALSLTNVRALNFGTQVQGASAVTVDPVTGGTNTAYFTLTGAPASQVLTISWTSTANLTYSTTNISWTPSVAANSTATQSTASTLSSGGTAAADGTGHLYLWVGGTTAPIPSNAPAGTYQGTVTLTVQY